MTIGLICAIPHELAALQSAFTENHTEAVAHSRFITGVLDGHDVVIAGSGMGKVNAAIVTTLLADRFDCRTIVFSGVAGGLDPALSIGDVVVADRIVQHDAGVLENERVRTYQPATRRSSTPPIDSATRSIPTSSQGSRTDWKICPFQVKSSTAQSLPAIST